MKPKDFEVIYKFTVAPTVPFPSALNWNAEPIGELIRCKDCGHWKYEDSGTDGTVQGECDLMCIFSDGMFFCAGAERKEE